MINIGTQFGKGGTGLTDGTLAKAIKELQSRKETVITGAAANTNMPVAGIKTTDTLVSAIAYASGVPSDVLSTLSITSDGNVQSTAVQTGSKIVLGYVVGQ